MPLPELVCRGKQETFKLVDRVRARAATTSEFQRKSGRLARFISNNATLFFEGAFDAGVPESLQVSNADECQSILITAHHALRGKFNLLGYRALEFGDPIDWRLDPVAQRRAPDLHWSLLKPLDPLQVGDSKVIWELNRHQWLVHLAQAWRLTGDHRYAAAVVRSIQAWLRKNPTGIGINWASSLEVAFRLVAWSWALLLIRDADVLTPDAFADIENAACAASKQ